MVCASDIHASQETDVFSRAPKRLKSLRSSLKRAGFLGILVPCGDKFLNEFVPDEAKRLRWLLGFTGSAGLGIVTQSSAVLFVDGRYLSQAQWEVESHGISVQDISQQRPKES